MIDPVTRDLNRYMEILDAESMTDEEIQEQELIEDEKLESEIDDYREL